MFSITDIHKPQILAVEKDFLLVYKPPRMHSAPLAKSNNGETLLHWCVMEFPEIADLPGRKKGEGGLLHRLDYETQGLVLLARNTLGMESLLEQQREGKILKEYGAMSTKSEVLLPGFPPFPNPYPPTPIQSAFRPYGPGRKAVRPVLVDKSDGKEQKAIYTTEILESNVTDEGFISFRLRILKGFRHQIRAHLAWFGLPILNDTLYGGMSYGDGLLALRACSLSFADPSSGEKRVYSIPYPLLPTPHSLISAAR